MLIGAHVSPAGGPANAVARGVEKGAKAIQFFNQSPRAWRPRIYSDDELKVGSRLELDLFLPDDTTLATKAVVVWVHEMPSGSPARYDVGVRFDAMDDADQQRLSHVLDEEGA